MQVKCVCDSRPAEFYVDLALSDFHLLDDSERRSRLEVDRQRLQPAIEIGDDLHDRSALRNSRRGSGGAQVIHHDRYNGLFDMNGR